MMIYFVVREMSTLPVTFLKDDIFSPFQEVEDGFYGVIYGASRASLKVNQPLFEDRIEGTAQGFFPRDFILCPHEVGDQHPKTQNNRERQSKRL